MCSIHKLKSVVVNWCRFIYLFLVPQRLHMSDLCSYTWRAMMNSTHLSFSTKHVHWFQECGTIFFFLNKNTKKSSLLTDLLTSIQEQDWGVTSFIPVLWNKSSSECSMHVKYHREACLSMASCQGGLGETLSVIHLWSLNFHALNCSIL